MEILEQFFILSLNAEQLQKLTGNYIVSNAKIINELGLQKMSFIATEGFIKTIQSFDKK